MHRTPAALVRAQSPLGTSPSLGLVPQNVPLPSRLEVHPFTSETQFSGSARPGMGTSGMKNEHDQWGAALRKLIPMKVCGTPGPRRCQLERQMVSGHLAGSVDRACNSWSWCRGLKPHVWHRVYLKRGGGGAWVAQLIKHLTLDFSSGHDLTVRGFEPHIGFCADSVEPAWDSLPLSAPSLKQKKSTFPITYRCLTACGNIYRSGRLRSGPFLPAPAFCTGSHGLGRLCD